MPDKDGKEWSFVACELMFDNAEVEKALLEHPDVAEATLRKMPDSQYDRGSNSVLVLYVRLKDELADKRWYIPGELEAFADDVKEHLRKKGFGLPTNTLLPLAIIIQIVKPQEGKLSEAADKRIKELTKLFAENKSLRYHQV